MSRELENQIQQLKQAIAEIEAQRPILGDAAVDSFLEPYHQMLADLEVQLAPITEEPEELPTRQRKLVTLLYMDVVGSTQMTQHLDPEDALEMMDNILLRLVEPIQGHGGRVTRYTGDGFKAVFGDPIAREDDPEQAIRAGLEILELSKVLSQEIEQEWGIKHFQVRIGIDTGLAALGGRTEAEDTVKGRVVNLAVRIEGAAPPGGLLISHNTYRHVRGVFTVEPQEQIKAKGFPEPVPVYLVKAIKPRAFRVLTRGVEGVETRMVGRETELKILQDALLNAIEEGEGHVVIVSGEAGVGKSRLLYEFQNWIELLPDVILFFQGRGRQEAQGLPYTLLRDVFSFRFQILDDDTGEQARSKVEAGFGDVFGEDKDVMMRAHILGQLLGFNFSASSHLKGVLNDAEQLRNRGLMYLREYFHILSQESPVVIFLEDIHWGDDSSLEAVNKLAELTPQLPILIVCAARSVLFERDPCWGKDQTYHTRIKILSLSELESRSLLVEILQLVDEIPANLQEMVTKRAEGNPFYMEEMIKMLIEDGVIVPRQESWIIELAHLEQIEVPSTLAGVLQARLDGLPIHERTVLQQASVVGRLFWDRIVSFIQEEGGNGYDAQLIPIALTSLRKRELVYRHEVSAFAGAVEYLFKHDVLREVTYESVIKRQRNTYHGLVADWMIANCGDRISEYSGLIAEHLFQAGKWEQSCQYYLQAGEYATKLSSNSEAETYFSRVLKATKRIEPQTDTTNYRIRAHIALGDLFTLTGKFDEALEQFHLAQITMDSKDFYEEKPHDFAELYRKIADVFERQSEYDLAFQWIDNGLSYLYEDQVTIEAARMYLLGAGIYHRQGKNKQALEWCQKSLSIASQIDTMDGQKVVAHAYYNLSGIHRRLSDFNLALDFSQKSLRIFKQIYDIIGQADAHNNLSIVYADLGDWDKAIDHLRKSLAIKEKIGDVFYQAALTNNLAEIYRDQGKWQQAIKLYEQSNAIWKQLGASLFDAVTLSNLGQVYVYMGDFSEAQECLTDAEKLFVETDSDDYLSELERRWGEYYLRTGDLTQAIVYIEHSIELADEQEARFDLGLSLRVLGEIHIERGDFDQAESVLARSLCILEELGCEFEAAKTMLALTHLALERGIEPEQDQIDNAIQIFKKLGAREDLIYAQSLSNRLC